MKLLTALLSLILLVGCMTQPMEITYISAKPEAQTPLSGQDIFYVNFDIIVFREQTEKYPETWSALKRALVEWAFHIPVRWTILYENEHGPYNFKERYKAIEIHIANIHSPEYGASEHMLGKWQRKLCRIIIDGDTLEGNVTVAYSICLHELGHMIGLSHVVNYNEIGFTGYIVLPEGVDASQYVMYPNISPYKEQTTLSQMEIDLAKNALLHYWTLPNDLNSKN